MVSRKTNDSEQRNSEDIRDAVLELNFVPDWAKKPANEVHFTESPAKRPPRKQSRERRRAGGRPPRRNDKAHARGRHAPRNIHADKRPRVEMPEVDVRFLPERKRLNAVTHQVKISNRAYPLRDVADLFLTKAHSCEVRFECRSEDKSEKLFQCRICKTAALKKDNIVDHVVGAHIEEFFRVEERQVDAPAGVFVCVARCGLSGVILGPPNHHSYAAKTQEIHKTKYSHMSMHEYQEHIETTKDEAVIEQWKTECSRQTFYSLKKDPSGENADMDWAGAEAYVVNNLASSVIHHARTVVMPLAVARKMDDESLVLAAKEAWKKENRFPVSLTVALRGAFRSRKLAIFRVGKDAVFVSAIHPDPLNRAHVVDNILGVLAFLDDHPGCTRTDLLKGLHPELKEGTPEAVNALAPLSWLIEKGHIIEFYNGTLAVPKRKS